MTFDDYKAFPDPFPRRARCAKSRRGSNAIQIRQGPESYFNGTFRRTSRTGADVDPGMAVVMIHGGAWE